MYAVIRRYKVKPGSAEEIARRAQQGCVPLMREIPGFVAYHGLVPDRDDMVVTISIFEDRAGEQESTLRSAAWVRQNLAEFVDMPPEIIAGRIAWGAQK